MVLVEVLVVSCMHILNFDVGCLVCPHASRNRYSINADSSFYIYGGLARWRYIGNDEIPELF